MTLSPLPPRPLFPGSLFPNHLDPVVSQPHDQVADCIMAIELSLLPGGSLSLQDHVAAADPHPQYARDGQGLPTGGTTGQVLTKLSALDYDVAWQTPTGGGGGLTLPLTQDLTFSPDGVWSVGQSAAFRPKNGYFTRELLVGDLSLWYDSTIAAATQILSIRTSAAQPIQFATRGIERWQIDEAGHFSVTEDINNLNIGYPTGGKPFRVFVEDELHVGDLITLDGGSLVKSDGNLFLWAQNGSIIFQASGVLWSFDTDGTLSPGISGGYNIGRQAGLTIGNIFMGGFVQMNQRVGATGPTTSGYVDLYAKTDGRLYSKDQSGTEVLLGGTTGGGGGDLTFVFTQGTPSTTWVVVHSLNKYPAVDVVDTGGSTIIPSVHYDSPNQVTLTFGSATTGKAYMN